LREFAPRTRLTRGATWAQIVGFRFTEICGDVVKAVDYIMERTAWADRMAAE